MDAKPHVIFYTKPGCHLCEEARREIDRAGCADAYTFAEVNIETDPALRARYGWDIPVVRIDGTDTFKHRLTAEEFRRAVSSRQ
jgi:glutaredoxin